MKQKGLKAMIFLGILLSLASLIPAQNNYRLANGPMEFYYGHISYVDTKNAGKDPIVIREGSSSPESAVVNLPLGPGDLIQTFDGRRCEIQFDNGTIIRLDYGTRLKIETILAQSLSSRDKVSNLVLETGGIYVMYKQYNSKEIFQVIAPNASVKFKHNTVAMLQLSAGGDTEVQVKYGKAYALYGLDRKNLKEQAVDKLEKLTISRNNTFAFAPYVENTDFEAWNKAVNADFEALHEGMSKLPMPIQKLPWAVFYFAQKFGNLNGEWLYDQMYGYIWRPFINTEMYPWGWQPYVYGHWTTYGGQMFWVPDEPWGWVPYHLGIWQWDKKRGWFWIPGSAFAPAWVDWAFFYGGSYFAWRPWTYWDWMVWQDWNMFSSYWGPGFEWEAYQYFYYGPGFYSWYQVGPNGGFYADGSVRRTVDKVSRDQLKRPAAPPLPMPKELKGISKILLAALKKGDENVRASIRGPGMTAVVVKREDLTARNLQGKTMPLDSFARALEALPSQAPQRKFLSIPPKTGSDSLMYAVNSFIRDGRIIGLQNAGLSGNRLPSGAKMGGAVSVQRPLPAALRNMVPGPVASVRVRDWNPDFRAAQKLGVDIRYSSLTNEVYCPQLRVSSSGSLYGRSAGSSTRGGFGSSSSSDSGGGRSSGATSSGASSGSSVGTTSGSSGSSSGTAKGGGVIKSETPK